MLTPQDVKTKEFTKAVFGGYDMAAVDDFLEELSTDYETLYKETAILKNKLKVLVEKVEEYRSTEDAMRMALLTAQKMSKDILDEAKAKSESMVSDAEKNARGRIEQLKADVANEEKKLEAAKARTAAWAKQARETLTRQIEILDRIDEIAYVERAAEPAAPAPAPAPVEPAPEAPAAAAPASNEARIDETARDIEDSLSRIFEQDISSERPEPAEKPAQKAGHTTTRLPRLDDVDEPTSPHPKFDFSNLQFGANYDINERKKK